MRQNIIVLEKGGMKRLKERLKVMKVRASEPTILRALRGQDCKRGNEGLYRLIRKVALEMGGKK